MKRLFLHMMVFAAPFFATADLPQIPEFEKYQAIANFFYDPVYNSGSLKPSDSYCYVSTSTVQFLQNGDLCFHVGHFSDGYIITGLNEHMKDRQIIVYDGNVIFNGTIEKSLHDSCSQYSFYSSYGRGDLSHNGMLINFDDNFFDKIFKCTHSAEEVDNFIRGE